MKYILILLFSFTLQAQSLLLLFDDEVDSTTTLPPAVWSQDPTLQMFTNATPALGSDLITNGDLEVNTVGWASPTRATFVISSDYAYLGNYSGKLIRDATGSTGYTYTVPQATVGTYYLFSAYLRNNTASQILLKENYSTASYLQIGSAITSTSWTVVNSVRRATNAISGVLLVEVTGTDGQTGYIDNISVKPLTNFTPPAYANDYSGSRIGTFSGSMETVQPGTNATGIEKGFIFDGVNDALSFPWTATSIWTITATSSANPTLTLKGTDYVSIDWGDSTITTILLTSSDQNISHTYTKNMQRSVRFINSEKITKFQTLSNLNWSFNLNTFPASVDYIYIGGTNTITGDVADFKTGLTYITIYGSNTISGNLADFKTGLTTINITGSNTITGNVTDFKTGLTTIYITGSNTITGNVEDFKTGLTTIYIAGSNTITGNVEDFKTGLIYIYITGSNTITGNVADFKTGLTTISIFGSNTITGNVTDFKTGLTTIYIAGSNTITGNVADFKTGLTIISITGSNTITDYTSKTWWNGIDYIRINPTTGYGLSSAEVDQLIIDLSATTWGGTTKTLELKGSNAAPTSASESARTSLQAQGVTVNVN